MLSPDLSMYLCSKRIGAEAHQTDQVFVLSAALARIDVPFPTSLLLTVLDFWRNLWFFGPKNRKLQFSP